MLYFMYFLLCEAMLVQYKLSCSCRSVCVYVCVCICLSHTDFVSKTAKLTIMHIDNLLLSAANKLLFAGNQYRYAS